MNADIPATVQRVQDSGNGSLQYDVDCTTLDGKAVSINLNAVPLVDPNGTKMGVVLVLDDITTEKRLKSDHGALHDQGGRRASCWPARAALGGSAQKASGAVHGHPQLHHHLREARARRRR